MHAALYGLGVQLLAEELERSPVRRATSDADAPWLAANFLQSEGTRFGRSQ
jgi:hypothetical protein